MAIPIKATRSLILKLRHEEDPKQTRQSPIIKQWWSTGARGSVKPVSLNNLSEFFRIDLFSRKFILLEFYWKQRHESHEVQSNFRRANWLRWPSVFAASEWTCLNCYIPDDDSKEMVLDTYNYAKEGLVVRNENTGNHHQIKVWIIFNIELQTASKQRHQKSSERPMTISSRLAHTVMRVPCNLA